MSRRCARRLAPKIACFAQLFYSVCGSCDVVVDMSTIACQLVNGFNKPPFAVLNLPAVPREGETLMVGVHGAADAKIYVVKGVGYRATNHGQAGENAAEPVVVLKVDEK
jgi:hypothetical protein